MDDGLCWKFRTVGAIERIGRAEKNFKKTVVNDDKNTE